MFPPTPASSAYCSVNLTIEAKLGVIIVSFNSSNIERPSKSKKLSLTI